MKKREPDLVVSLAGEDLDVFIPHSYAERLELVGAFSVNRFRAAAAILAVCVPGLDLELTLAQFSYSVPRLGEQALNMLHARGTGPVDIIRASVPILNELERRTFPGDAEVLDRVGFGKASEDEPIASPAESTSTTTESSAGSTA